MRLTTRLLSSLIKKRPFYITTPIFYVNAAPHLGHLYTAVVADAIQRFEKLTNPDSNVIFSTGTDEHGTKIQQAASKANLSLPDYCNAISKEYKDIFKEFHVEYTDFIRTSEERHKKAVKHFWTRLLEKDYIYKAKYSGWYSVNDEAFVPDAQTRVSDDGKVRVSVESGHMLEWTEETNYMFRLSEFKQHLKRWLQTDGVVTPSKFQKNLQEMVEDDVYLPDISVSRPASRVHWAIRVPDDEEQSIYVWLDALINYLTVCGYPDDELMKHHGRPWPADLHVVGKDILKFHGIYWPAFLMAIKWHPPRQVLCHSHWTVDGSKMSKSLNNVVNPRHTAASHALRYLLLREATLADDANYSETKLINVANSELADTLGNLVSRSCGPALNPRCEFPALHQRELVECCQLEVTSQLLDAVEKLADKCHAHYSNYQFYKSVDAVIHALHLANLFFESLKPWELRKNPENQKRLDVVLHITLETLRICSIILQPIVPDIATKVLDKLQVGKQCRAWNDCERPSWRVKGAISETRNIQSGHFVLFPRIYVDKSNVKNKKASA